MTYALPLMLAQAEPAAPPPPPVVPDEGVPVEGVPSDATVGPDGASGQRGTGGGEMLWLIILLGFVLLWVFMLGGQRREKKKRATLLAALKKGDRIQTVGGILGTIVEVRENEVVVKVDENANTRMRFARSAIQNVVEEKAD